MPHHTSELCDTNVWLALTLERHTLHTRALSWFNTLKTPKQAVFTRMTQLSFLRILTSEKILGKDAVTNLRAISLYETILSDPRCRLEPEPKNLQKAWYEYAGYRSKSPKVWMDSYLAAFCKETGLRLVTFDQGFKNYSKLPLNLL